jgi:hypothetical protein
MCVRDPAGYVDFRPDCGLKVERANISRDSELKTEKMETSALRASITYSDRLSSELKG